MDENKKEPTVRELFEAVRKGMVFRGKALPEKFDKFASARLWLEEENITTGIFVVRSIAMHDNYVKWCKERGLKEASILGSNKLGEFLSSQFQPVNNRNNTTSYYISKELTENEEEKAKRKEKYGKNSGKNKKPQTEES